MASSSNAPVTLRSKVITQIIAVVGFVVVPTLVTLIAPRSTVTFVRDAEHVSVVVRRHALLFVPWQTRRVDHVSQLRAEVTEGKRYGDLSEDRRRGRENSYSAATGQVAIVGDGPEVIVQADPEQAPLLEQQFEAYRNSTNARPMSITVYASFWLTYGVGGVCTFFAALYIFGAVAALVQMALRRGRG